MKRPRHRQSTQLETRSFLFDVFRRFSFKKAGAGDSQTQQRATAGLPYLSLRNLFLTRRCHHTRQTWSWCAPVYVREHPCLREKGELETGEREEAPHLQERGATTLTVQSARATCARFHRPRQRQRRAPTFFPVPLWTSTFVRYALALVRSCRRRRSSGFHS